MHKFLFDWVISIILGVFYRPDESSPLHHTFLLLSFFFFLISELFRSVWEVRFKTSRLGWNPVGSKLLDAPRRKIPKEKKMKRFGAPRRKTKTKRASLILVQRQRRAFSRLFSYVCVCYKPLPPYSRCVARLFPRPRLPFQRICLLCIKRRRTPGTNNQTVPNNKVHQLLSLPRSLVRSSRPFSAFWFSHASTTLPSSTPASSIHLISHVFTNFNR